MFISKYNKDWRITLEKIRTIKSPTREYSIYKEDLMTYSTVLSDNTTYMRESIIKIEKLIYEDILSNYWLNAPEVDMNSNLEHISVDKLQTIVDYIKESNVRFTFFNKYINNSKYRNIFNFILDNGNALLFKDYDTFILHDFLSIYTNIPEICMNLGWESL